MNRNKKQVLKNLRGIDEYEFEQFIAELWEKQGWSTNVTQGSNDRGVDIVAKTDSPFPQKHLIQAKRYAEGNKISSPAIQQYSSLRHQESDSDAVIVVTTSSFTPQAIESADSLNVKLIDGEQLYKIVQEHDSLDLVEQYTGMGENSTHSSLQEDSTRSDENWAEAADKLHAQNAEKDTVYDVLSRTKNKEASWPRNLIPVSDLTDIRNTLMRCLSEVIEEKGQGVIKWAASDFEYAVVVDFTRQGEWTTDGRVGAEISFEIAKKDRVGQGVDLDVGIVWELSERFGYRLQQNTEGSFTSVTASKNGFEDEFNIIDELSTIEYIIEDVTDQSLQDINYVSVVDPDQFGQ